MKILKTIIESLMEIKIKGTRSKTKKAKEVKPVRKKGQMATFDPAKSKPADIIRASALIQGVHPGKIVEDHYMINTEGTSNKFHYFATVKAHHPKYTVVSVYGRIGYPPKVAPPIYKGDSDMAASVALNRKVRAKRSKGYRDF